MIVDKGMSKLYLRNCLLQLCNTKSLCLVLVMMCLLNSADAMKCYVCGHGSEAPFSKMNATVRQKIHKSCDEFDRVPLEEKFKYEMDCPGGSVGCSLMVKSSVMRTCSDVGVDDCKTVNNVHYCYCNKALCNGENAESIIEKYGDVNDDDEDGDVEEVDNENIDSDEASGSNEETNYSNASRGADADDQSSHEHETTTTENRVLTSTVPSTPAFTINKAVNSNLSRNLVNLLSCAYLIISITHRNWNN